MDDTELQRYLAAQFWTLREAAYLLCDLSPGFDDAGFAAERKSGSDVAWAYRGLKDATRDGTLKFERADARDTLMNRLVRPSAALAWAKHRGIAIPACLQPLIARKTAGYAAHCDEHDVPIKRAALVKRHEKQWPTIERDLKDASKNGLSAAAKADRHGDWYEKAALAWAKGRGKLTDNSTSFTSTWSGAKSVYRMGKK